MEIKIKVEATETRSITAHVVADKIDPEEWLELLQEAQKRASKNNGEMDHILSGADDHIHPDDRVDHEEYDDVMVTVNVGPDDLSAEIDRLREEQGDE